MQNRDRLFHSVVMAGHTVDCFRNVVQYKIQVDFIFLKIKTKYYSVVR